MIKTRKDLEKIKAAETPKLAMRQGFKRLYIIVQMGEKGIDAGAKALLDAFILKLNEKLIFDCAIVQGPGTEYEDIDPVVEIEEKDKTTIYGNVTLSDVDKIIESHILCGEIVKDLLVEVKGGK